MSTTTLARMARGRKPDASSLAALSAWAGVNPAEFVDIVARPKMREPLAQMTAIIRSDPRLGAEAAVALEEMLKAAYQRMKTKV